MNELTERTKCGAEIAARGAALASDYFKRRATLESGSKLAPLDLVTEADRAVEEQLKADLAKAFPDDGFWGEESGGAPATSLGWRTPSTALQISWPDCHFGVLRWPMSLMARYF